MTTPRSLKIVLLLVGLVGLPILAFWLGGRLLEVRNAAKDMVSQGRFGQIEGLLRMYYDEHGAFPPTKYQPVAGGPIHSWRVLLIPSLGERRNYDFSQEWNSPTNLQALGRLPPHSNYFRLDGDSESTHYLSIGEDEQWPATKPLRSRLITKGKDRFLVIEYLDSEIHWMEPKY